MEDQYRDDDSMTVQPTDGLLTTIGKQQISMFSAALSWQYMVPTLIGLVLLAIGLALIFTKGGVAKKTDDDETDEEKEKTKQWLYAGLGIGGAGLLTVIVTRIVLMLNHKAAAGEQMVFDAFSAQM
jgi:hypothetical protein